MFNVVETCFLATPVDEDESSPDDAEEKGATEDSEPQGVEDTSAEEVPAAREPKSEL